MLDEVKKSELRFFERAIICLEGCRVEEERR